MDSLTGIQTNIPYTQGRENIIIGLTSFYVFLWILSIIWVSKDISARTQNISMQIISILLITLLSPIVGLPLYITIRPIRYKPTK